MTPDSYIAIGIWGISFISAIAYFRAKLEDVIEEQGKLMDWRELHERESNDRRLQLINRIAQLETNIGKTEMIVQEIFRRLDSIDRKLDNK